MARNNQKLINFHGSQKANLEQTYTGATEKKEVLDLGEIAVIHSTKDAMLAISDGANLHYFLESATTVEMIEAAKGDLSELSSATVAIENNLTVLSGQVISFSGATVQALKDASADTVAVEEKLLVLSSATEAFSGAVVTELENVRTEMLSGDVKSIKINTGKDGNPYIQLFNNEGGLLAEVNAKDFVVDGMLSSVTYDASAHTITFEWNTDAGSKRTTIDLDDVMQPIVADNVTITATTEDGKLKFSAIKDQEGGVASYKLLKDFSGATVDEFKAVRDELKAASGAILEHVEVVSGAILEHVEVVSGAILEHIESVSGSILDYVDAASGDIESTILKLSADTHDHIMAVDDKVEELSGVVEDIIAKAAHTTLKEGADNEKNWFNITSAATKGGAEYTLTLKGIDALSARLETEIQELSAGTMAADKALEDELKAASGAIIEHIDTVSGYIVTELQTVESDLETLSSETIAFSGAVVEILKTIATDEELKALSGAVKTFSAATVEEFEAVREELATASGNIESTILALSSATIAGLEQASADTIAVETKLGELSAATEAFSGAVVEELDKVAKQCHLEIIGEDEKSGATIHADGKTYKFIQGGVEIGSINVMKDSFVHEGEVVVFESGSTLPSGVTEYGTYLHLQIFERDEEGEQKLKDIYINVNKLVDAGAIEELSGAVKTLSAATVEEFEAVREELDAASGAIIEHIAEVSGAIIDHIDVVSGDIESTILALSSATEGLEDKLAELSSATEAFSSATVGEIERLDERIDALSGKSINAITLNGVAEKYGNEAIDAAKLALYTVSQIADEKKAAKEAKKKKKAEQAE